MTTITILQNQNYPWLILKIMPEKYHLNNKGKAACPTILSGLCCKINQAIYGLAQGMQGSTGMMEKHLLISQSEAVNFYRN